MQQFTQRTANKAAGISFHTALIKLGYKSKSTAERIRSDCQMIDTAAKDHEGSQADAAHLHSGFCAENMYHEQVQ